MLNQKGMIIMNKPLTLTEIVPDVIRDIKMLDRAIKDEEITNYQIGLCLTSILYSLEHPEKHFTDGTVIY